MIHKPPSDTAWRHLSFVYNRARGIIAALALASSLTVGFINGWPRGPLVPLACSLTVIHALSVLRSSEPRVLQMVLFDGLVLSATTALIGLPQVAVMSAAFLMVVATVLETGTRVWWLYGFALTSQTLALGVSNAFFSPYTESQAALTGTVGVVFLALTTVGLMRSLVRTLWGAEQAQLQAEHEVRKRERRFSAMVEHISDGITLADADGMVRYTGAQNERLTGHRGRLGAKMDELIIDEDKPLLASAVERLLERDGRVERFAVRIRHAEGSIRVMDVTATNRLHDPDLNAIVANFRDVTDEVLAREALERANSRLEELVRSKDEFVASVSHELRTPLTAVVGMAELLSDEDGGFDAAELAEFRTTLLVQARETAAIVEDLLVAARADIGQVTILREPCDISADVDRVLSAQPDRSKVAVRVPAGMHVHADPTRLRQILRNLVSNALRHGGHNIEITGTRVGGAVVLRVSDDGDGVTPEDRARIFEPYARSTGSPTQPASIGLGLTVSRTLARMMDGDLTYRRESGRSHFELVLPHSPVESLAS